MACKLNTKTIQNKSCFIGDTLFICTFRMQSVLPRHIDSMPLIQNTLENEQKEKVNLGTHRISRRNAAVFNKVAEAS
jgi:hypothetical protein